MTRHICNKRRNSLNDFSHLRIGSVQFFRNLRHFSIWREVKAASPADDLSAARRWSSLPFINHKSHGGVSMIWGWMVFFHFRWSPDNLRVGLTYGLYLGGKTFILFIMGEKALSEESGLLYGFALATKKVTIISCKKFHSNEDCLQTGAQNLTK